jgi:hypothetical protein
MKQIATKLLLLAQTITKEKGPLQLFALFLREDAPDLWDLLVSASWITNDKESALRYFAGKLTAILTKHELVRLSRIVIIDKENPALEALHRAAHVENSIMEVQDSVFFGMQIKHAYIITSIRGNREGEDNRKQ